MAPQLQDLPDELLVEVLGYLRKSDLKSARLTCTRYGHIGAQWLFQRVYFAPRKVAIDIFLNISANPNFARTVTELVYDGRQFSKDLTFYTPYKKALDAYCYVYAEIARVRRIRDGGGSTTDIDVNSPTHQEFLAMTLVHYVRHYDQQQRILEERKDYEALLSGLKNFSNLTTVIALDDFTHDRVPLRTDDHSWYHQHSTREFDMPVPPSSPSAGNWYNEDDGFQRWSVLGINNLIRAVSQEGQNVKELQIGSETSSLPMAIFKMHGDVYHDACTMARRLTSLKMDLYMPRMPHEDDRQKRNDCFNGFLSQAKELRCLAMSGDIDPDVIKDKVWPHLETLNWVKLEIGAADIKAIIHAHKSTLRELTLSNVYMHGEEGWADAAKEMGQYLRLGLVRVLRLADEATRRITGDAYLEDEANLVVARSFMQSVPGTTLLDEFHYTIIACPGEGEAGNSHGS
ncbi:MAG: hypothetical protein Q9161_000805 [Pseudevernia consocians]